MNGQLLAAAPMEGLTTAVFRRLHHQYFGGTDLYYIPFITPTVEPKFTDRHLKELSPEVNAGIPVVPQLLSNRSADFIWAAKALQDLGYKEVNLNLGCPSGTVVAKGKGSGFLRDLYALIFAFFLFCGYALYRSFSLQEIGRACRQSIAKISNIIIVMLLIGALTASWRASGPIAYLVSYASEIISPSWSLLGTFILNAALSSLIGTSFGTAATMGVVTMSLCVGMGVSPFWAGGAALAGAYVGDRCSPVSTSAQLLTRSLNS